MAMSWNDLQNTSTYKNASEADRLIMARKYFDANVEDQTFDQWLDGNVEASPLSIGLSSLLAVNPEAEPVKVEQTDPYAPTPETLARNEEHTQKMIAPYMEKAKELVGTKEYEGLNQEEIATELMQAKNIEDGITLIGSMAIPVGGIAGATGALAKTIAAGKTGATAGAITGASNLVGQQVGDVLTAGDQDLDYGRALEEGALDATLTAGTGILGSILGKGIKTIIEPGKEARRTKIKAAITADDKAVQEAEKATYDVLTQERLGRSFDVIPTTTTAKGKDAVTLPSKADPTKTRVVPVDKLTVGDVWPVAKEGTRLARSNATVPNRGNAEVLSGNDIKTVRELVYPGMSPKEFAKLPIKDVQTKVASSKTAEAVLAEKSALVPDLNLRNVAEQLATTGSGKLAKVIPQDLSVLPLDVQKQLGMGSLARTVSKLGSIAEGGIGSFVRQNAATEASTKAIKQGTEDLTGWQSFYLRNGQDKNAALVGDVIENLKQGKDLTPAQNKQLMELGIRAKNDANLDGDSVYDAYNKARAVTKGTDVTGAAREGGLLNNVGILAPFLSGGTSLLGQVPLAAAKNIVDRGVINDVRRVVNGPLKGDATRTAAGNLINEAATGPAMAATVRGMSNVPEQASMPVPKQEEWAEVADDEWEPVEADDEWTDVEEEPVTLGSKLYDAFATAETGGIEDPFIRTRAKDKSSNLHSSAYGPVQITATLAQDYLTRKPDLFNEEEKEYLHNFIKQGQLFLAASKGQIDDPRLQYGGKGILTSPRMQQLYKQVAMKMLEDTYRSNGGDLEKTLSSWRGLVDTAYNNKVVQALTV